MGLPLDARTAAANQLDSEWLNAPLTLQTETYESFTQRLNSSLGQDEASQASVAEELRRLQIDPEVFYANAQRLGVREYRADDMDPTIEAGRSPEPASLLPQAPPTFATMASLLAVGDSDNAIAAVDQFMPPTRGPEANASEPLNASRIQEIESYCIETEADNACRLGMCGINVPDGEVCEEILLDGSVQEETRGGRLSCETPRGLEAKLQIDSLTDDEDDEVFKTSPSDAPRVADEEDAIEAFALDPDFDYDTVTNLTSRF
jgi:hypothetical protein